MICILYLHVYTYTGSEQHELYEEAFTIYVKFGKKSTGDEQVEHHINAVSVLVDNIRDLERAKEFAERVNTKQVR